MRKPVLLSLFVVLVMLQISTRGQDVERDTRELLNWREVDVSGLAMEWRIDRQMKIDGAMVRSERRQSNFQSSPKLVKIRQWSEGFLFSIKNVALPAPFTLPKLPQEAKPRQLLPREEEWVVLKTNPTAIIGGIAVDGRVLDATAQRFYGSGRGLGGALCTALLLGMSPLRMLDKGYVAQREGQMVRVRGRFLSDILAQGEVPEVDLVLDGTKGYAPARMRATTAHFFEEVRVLKWRRHAGVWLPQDVECMTRLQVGSATLTNKMHAQLTGVVRASAQSPIWLSDDLIIQDERGGSPSVVYQLKQGVPTMEELKRMHKRESQDQESRVEGLRSFWRLAPPFF